MCVYSSSVCCIAQTHRIPRALKQWPGQNQNSAEMKSRRESGMICIGQ